MCIAAYGVQHCKRELCVSGWFHFCCSSCSVIVGKGYAVCCFGFQYYIIRVMLTGVGGYEEVERGYTVYGCRKGCMCIVQVREWGEVVVVLGCVSRCMRIGVYVAGEWVYVLMEKRWYLPRCCG
jgi:hypothetical protein